MEDLAVNLIDPPRVELRAAVSEAEVRALARSIQEHGLLHPVGVRKEGERYRLLWGHRRWLAHKWLGREKVLCQLRAEGEDDGLELSVIENLARRDLNPVEEARALRGMVDGRGLSVGEAAAAVSRSESWVRLRLEVLHWPDEVVEALSRGELNVAVARELVGVEEDETRQHYVRCAIESGCTGVQARMWRQEWEVASAGRASVGDGGASGILPRAPVEPTVQCHVCEGMVRVTQVVGLRVCGPCVAELESAKRGGRESPVG